MSDSQTVRSLFCSSCGKPTAANARFCLSCGAQVNGGQQSPALSDDSAGIETNLRKFRARLTASCPHCRYHGLMGWNDFHFPIARAVWMPVAILLCLVGVIPGLIVFLLVQRAKRYQAECPNCGHALLLKMNEAQPVKSSWGGAQFYDSSGAKVPDGKMLARAGKWLLIGVAGVMGLLILFAALGMLIERAGIKVPSTSDDATPPAEAVKEASPSYPEYSSANLVQEYVNNAVRADQQLKGLTIMVRGTITEIGKDDAGSYFVGLNGVSEDSLVKCVFSDDHASHLAQLQKGMETALRGRVYGWVQLNVGDVGVAGRVDLTECMIAPSGASAANAHRDPSAQAVAWVAMSRTAMAITGDIQLGSDRIVMSNGEFPLALVRTLEARELVDARKITDASQVSSARLFKTNVPPTAKLVNGNTICGTDSAKWLLAVYNGESDLSLAFFSGENEPNLDYSFIYKAGGGLCGTYGYSRSQEGN
jgi:hypothetical protein